MSQMNDDLKNDLNEKQQTEINDSVLETNTVTDERADEEKEQIYESAVKFIKSINCMAVCKEKADMYKKTAKEFLNLNDYKKSEHYYKVCRKLAKQTKKEIEAGIYNKAQEMKKSARSSQDYIEAAEEFRKVSGYGDADDMAAECKQLSSRMDRKATRNRLIRCALVILCIAALIIGINTSHAKYYMANAFEFTGSYGHAISMYKKLGPYKDSKARIVKCEYLNGTELEQKGDYPGARKAYTAAGDYKDSEVKKADMEKLIIKNSKPGDSVRIGGYDWLILDIQAGKALLMKTDALRKIAYNDTPGDITWEKSTLRQRLNVKFLTETFSESEQKNIILTDLKNSGNAKYGTDGGNDTQDYIFILSMDEAEKYKDIFPEFKSDSWLRSPGSNQGSAAFLSVKGEVMDYGYETTSDKFYVRPAMWFNIK